VEIKMESISFEDALQVFFDNNLAPGMCYGSWRKAALPLNNTTTANNTLTLLYRDGTASSVYHAFSDVYRTSDNKYIVYTTCSWGDTKEICTTLEQVLLALISVSPLDYNTSADMVLYITGAELELYKCLGQKEIDILKNNPYLIQNMYDKSKRGEFIYNNMHLLAV
jgi:hypothetical protein